MPRPATGKVIEHQGKDGRVYRALRFSAYGRRRYLSLGVVSAGEADQRLRHILADVERGTWTRAEASETPPEPEPLPTFHQYAEQWWIRNQHRWAPKTQSDYRWRLETHLLPYFAEMALDAITFDAVEDYISLKRSASVPLAPRSINMTLVLLASIMETAVEREMISRNPAKGKGRRVPERTPKRSYLGTPAQIAALLQAAWELDSGAHPAGRHIERCAMLRTLLFAGLRIGELCSLRWRDVDLGSGWLHVSKSKTDAGVRRVKLRRALRDQLLAVQARQPKVSPDAFVFPTATGGPQSPDNLRSRVLKPAVGRANEILARQGLPPLQAGITPHSLRRTFATLADALGENPGIVMEEMGHANAGYSLEVYRQSARLDKSEKAAIRSLIDGRGLEFRRDHPEMASAAAKRRDDGVASRDGL
jgi:integrase